MLHNNFARPHRKPEAVSKGRSWPEDFCTACGDGLEEFCFSETSNDIKAIRRLFSRCKEKQKFTGGRCAKLYIAGIETLEPLSTERE